MAAKPLTEKELLELREMFDLFDSDKSGSISTGELGTMMRGIGQNPTKKQLEEIIKTHDKNDNGMMEFDEFVEMMKNNKYKKSHKNLKQELIDAFKTFDNDGSGTVDAAELQKVLVGAGENLTIQECEEMIAGCDLDGDGQLNYIEFANMMMDSGYDEI